MDSAEIGTMLLLTAFILVKEIYAECRSLHVSGTIYQKGIEGDYALASDVCTSGYPLYVQKQPAAGWGSIFYLYYYHDKNHTWKGWMFSIYGCSDRPFVRNKDTTTAPEKTSMPWEEFIDGNFLVNTDIEVKCTDGDVPAYVILIVSLLGAILLMLLGLLPLFWMKWANRKQRASTNHASGVDRAGRHRSTTQALPRGFTEAEIPTVFCATPPPYCEQVPDFDEPSVHTMSSNPAESSIVPTANPARLPPDPIQTTGCHGAQGLYCQAPPSYEESLLTNNSFGHSLGDSTALEGSHSVSMTTHEDVQGAWDNQLNIYHIPDRETAAVHSGCSTQGRHHRAIYDYVSMTEINPQLSEAQHSPVSCNTQHHGGATWRAGGDASHLCEQPPECFDSGSQQRCNHETDTHSVTSTHAHSTASGSSQSDGFTSLDNHHRTLISPKATKAKRPKRKRSTSTSQR